jgi:hypothetical protein
MEQKSQDSVKGQSVKYTKVLMAKHGPLHLMWKQCIGLNLKNLLKDSS